MTAPHATRHQRWNREFNPSTMIAEQELHDIWKALNHQHFRGKLPAPKLAVYPPYRPDAYASFAGYQDGFAIIDVNPNIVNGTEPLIASASRDGRRRLLQDVLLHEAIHYFVNRVGHWNQEQTHAGAFATVARHISNKLGLPQTDDLSRWPYNSRPAGYFSGDPVPVKPPRATKPNPDITTLVAAIDAVTAQVRGILTQRNQPVIRAIVR